MGLCVSKDIFPTEIDRSRQPELLRAGADLNVMASEDRTLEEKLATALGELAAARSELGQVEADRDRLSAALEETQARHREADARIHADLELARDIQQGLLPAAEPEWEALDLLCYCKPASEIGGDFYAYHESNNAKVLLNKYVLAVGDVSGKGVSAALLMATALSRFDASFARPIGAAERLALLDQALTPYTKPRRQNCALCCVEIVGVNTVHPMLRTANAGCIPPFVKSVDGSVEWVMSEGPPLGCGLGAKSGYAEISKPLAKGDLVVLLSDGAVECRDEKGELFGFERFEEAIATGPADSAEALLEHLRIAVESFCSSSGGLPHDDVTLVVARV